MARVAEVAREVGEEVPRVLMSSAVLVDPSAERPNAVRFVLVFATRESGEGRSR